MNIQCNDIVKNDWKFIFFKVILQWNFHFEKADEKLKFANDNNHHNIKKTKENWNLDQLYGVSTMKLLLL